MTLELRRSPAAVLFNADCFAEFMNVGVAVKQFKANRFISFYGDNDLEVFWTMYKDGRCERTSVLSLEEYDRVITRHYDKAGYPIGRVESNI